MTSAVPRDRAAGATSLLPTATISPKLVRVGHDSVPNV
jgi:hypothetical protein